MDGLIFGILRYFKTHQNVKCHVSPQELAKRNGCHRRGICGIVVKTKMTNFVKHKSP